jgi:hypothetical protein
MLVLRPDEGDGIIPGEFFQPARNTKLHTGLIAVPAVNNHSISQRGNVALTMCADVLNESAKIIIGHRREGGRKRVL